MGMRHGLLRTSAEKRILSDLAVEFSVCVRLISEKRLLGSKFPLEWLDPKSQNLNISRSMGKILRLKSTKCEIRPKKQVKFYGHRRKN